MTSVGQLTAFTPPDSCSTNLPSCSALTCTLRAGMTCGPNGVPALASACFPDGSRFLEATRYILDAEVFTAGEACPGKYTPVTTRTYTTSTLPADWKSPISYFKATQVTCCPTGYIMDSYGACQSEIPAGPSVQYFCDLGTAIPATVIFPGRGEYPSWGNLTGLNTGTITQIQRTASARAITYISGPVTTALSTPSSRPDVATTSGTQLSEAKIVAIAVGVAIPVAFGILVALILCWSKRSNAAKRSRVDMVQNPNVNATAPIGTSAPAARSHEMPAAFGAGNIYSSPPMPATSELPVAYQPRYEMENTTTGPRELPGAYARH